MTADFDRLLDAVMPNPKGTVAMLEAYFDESERDRGLFAVAGYAFAKAQAKSFSKEWFALFGTRGCRMSELAAGNGRFRGVPSSERARLQKEAVKIITARISWGVAVSCDISEMDGLLPKHISGFEHAYPVCCHMAMTMLGMLVTDRAMNEQIAYFFETGHEFEGRARRFIEYMAKVPDEIKTSRHCADAWVAKDAALPLQAADMLVWEWGKYWDETRTKGKRPMRKSLIALLTDGSGKPQYSKRYRVTHLTGEPLRNAMDGVRRLELI
jgi:hypothetical protein